MTAAVEAGPAGPGSGAGPTTVPGWLLHHAETRPR